MIISSVNATLSVTTSLFRRSNNSLRSLTFCLPFSSSAAFVSSTDKRSRKKWSQPVFAALEVGGVKITKQVSNFEVKFVKHQVNMVVKCGIF
ncbi:hypothetical protein L195_g033739 [Trifolium pratense]|uniref:Uncharacterized protein n=1 Tax=Trifolium pratense TaxID=57577 RepID=A0A2K3LGW6_TRIPR|nr:hypothetical protein L195_g033739 [Trifolium pratense]